MQEITIDKIVLMFYAFLRKMNRNIWLHFILKLVITSANKEMHQWRVKVMHVIKIRLLSTGGEFDFTNFGVDYVILD